MKLGQLQKEKNKIPHATLRFQLRAVGISFKEEMEFHPIRKWRADFCITSAKLLVEIEGGGFVAGRHGRGAGLRSDCEKYAEAMILGYRVLRVVPDQVKDGTALGWIEKLLTILKIG